MAKYTKRIEMVDAFNELSAKQRRQWVKDMAGLPMTCETPGVANDALYDTIVGMFRGLESRTEDDDEEEEPPVSKQSTASYRTFYPHQHIADEISEPVLADSPAAAMKLLKTKDLRNLQTMENGVWVWVK